MHRLVIDTDPGVDDALAILMAHAAPNATVLALTIAAGNVGLAHTTRNALKLLELIDARTPVFPGAAAPLVAVPEDAAFVHGLDGFGDVGYEAPVREPEAEHAASALVRLARANPGELTFVMLGPLTNLALALALEPALPTLVKRLVVMGGAVTGRGNLPMPRLTVEFNIGFDPEAARVVFDAWPALELVDWEAVVRHGIAYSQLDAWFSGGSPIARFYEGISRKTRAFMAGTRDAEVWHGADALAMAVVLEPERVTRWARRAVMVELGGSHTRGMTVVDWNERCGRPANTAIALEFPLPRFGEMVAAALKSG
ncbi:MAG TPA: nucleoside hydrolase [Candidatus Saccharimonadia bacterium]|nr:nucleoside hydrolase [Candidatus Saccharimonadia bacterium]